ncbi:GerMN domain-containing protein [Knoellia locipacati]|uniref:Gmad2 immunoglobulin-like domain-containing protein n=1 Tax=Knoellia locipacati TaxID=882824 RepID=UPI00385149E8
MTRRSRRTRVAAGAVLLLVGLTACGDDGDGGPTPSATSSSSATTTSAPTATPSTSAPNTGTPTPSTTTTGSTLRSIPVYYVGESRRAVRLFREFRSVPDTGGPVASAVDAMTRLAPLDRDYSSPWRPARRVAVSQTGSALTVDLSGDAFSNTSVGSESAGLAIQQLVHTATAAAAQSGRPATTVTITKDGRAADVWGVVRVGSPVRRAPMADVQAHAWVVSPQQGQAVRAGRVAFTGFGTSFEATFSWVVRTETGTVVARGSAMGGTGTGGFGTVPFSATLTRGTYVVTLSTDDPSGGAEGSGPATDDKSFVVR